MPSLIKTPNIGLNQWTGNESPMRQDFVDDNFKIDDEIGKVKELVENISTKAKDITIEDATNVFDSTEVEGALLENKNSITELEKKTDTTNANVANLKAKVDAGQNHRLTTDNGAAILLDANFDLDTLLNAGTYNGASLLHAPNDDSGWWYIEIMQHTNLNGFVYQKATSLSDFNNIKVFHREMVGNTWGDWGSL